MSIFPGDYPRSIAVPRRARAFSRRARRVPDDGFVARAATRFARPRASRRGVLRAHRRRAAASIPRAREITPGWRHRRRRRGVFFAKTKRRFASSRRVASRRARPNRAPQRSTRDGARRDASRRRKRARSRPASSSRRRDGARRRGERPEGASHDGETATSDGRARDGARGRRARGERGSASARERRRSFEIDDASEAPSNTSRNVMMKKST